MNRFRGVIKMTAPAYSRLFTLFWDTFTTERKGKLADDIDDFLGLESTTPKVMKKMIKIGGDFYQAKIKAGV